MKSLPSPKLYQMENWGMVSVRKRSKKSLDIVFMSGHGLAVEKRLHT